MVLQDLHPAHVSVFCSLTQPVLTYNVIQAYVLADELNHMTWEQRKCQNMQCGGTLGSGLRNKLLIN